jgi:hypothetical protein
MLNNFAKRRSKIVFRIIKTFAKRQGKAEVKDRARPLLLGQMLAKLVNRK